MESWDSKKYWLFFKSIENVMYFYDLVFNSSKKKKKKKKRKRKEKEIWQTQVTCVYISLKKKTSDLTVS
jgi:hypothetical protein